MPIYGICFHIFSIYLTMLSVSEAHSNCMIDKGLIKKESTIDHWRSQCKERIIVAHPICIHSAETWILGWIIHWQRGRRKLSWRNLRCLLEIALRDWDMLRHASGWPRFETGTFHIYRSNTHWTSSLGLTEIYEMNEDTNPAVCVLFLCFVSQLLWGSGSLSDSSWYAFTLQSMLSLFYFLLKVVTQ
jgi:hypothetical protein